MSGPVRLDVGAYVELRRGIRVTEGLEDVLCRVVRAEGELRDIRRVSQDTGALEGIEVRFLATELRPARTSVRRWYEALRARSALAEWRRIGATDSAVTVALAAAEDLVAFVLNDDLVDAEEIAVCAYVSDRDGAQVVEIDSAETAGRIRVWLNEGTIYDGDPMHDEPPGEHYERPSWANRRQWKVQSLMTGDTTTYWATGKEDANAQYLDTVQSNLLIFEAEPPARCDECGAATGKLVSPEHDRSCSLYPPAPG
ncbi:hypothetical protein [Mycolicibacterium llatzerense]|uniref:hypothetical protein n=1 Tax=Mycolicibacterium llatzerense TaxID=280871 RepID=UPI0021B68F75|nr:hypothetical protein [Mycolicibacterium llatzerense]MCT7373280.1 hypothetical protein [Mycolicibacterium llatzerense]